MKDPVSIAKAGLIALQYRQIRRMRAAGRFADAAKAYSRILSLAPERTGALIQYGNMLRNSGQFADAERIYNDAQAREPQNSDIAVQQGHLCKTVGRRTDAVAYYRSARRLGDPNDDALKELALLGEVDELDEWYCRGHSVKENTYPASQYDRFRQECDWPAAPAPNGPVPPMHVFAPMPSNAPEQARVIRALVDQTFGQFTLHLLCSEADAPAGYEHLRAQELVFEPLNHVRGQWAAAVRTARDAGEAWFLLLEPGAVLHKRALEWLAWAISATHAAAFTFDWEWADWRDQSVRYVAPELRGIVDPLAAREVNNRCGTLAISAEALARLATDQAVSPSVETLVDFLAVRGLLAHIPVPLVAIDTALQPSTQSGRLSLPAPSDIDHNGTISATARRTRISIIINTKDNIDDVELLLHSIEQTADFPQRISFTLVDNGSDLVRHGARLAAISRRERGRVIRIDGPFNWSKQNNVAAQTAEAEILLFLNDDMEMLSRGWDSLLVDLLTNNRIGVVGAKLLYPDRRIQHAGIICGWNGSVIHDGLFEAEGSGGQGARWQTTRHVSAVTGAFLGVRSTDFMEAGGFDEDSLAVSYSDVDLCFRLRERGLGVVYCPHIVLFHAESKSRGLDHLETGKRARDAAEREVMTARWANALTFDPTVNPYWCSTILPFRLLEPAGVEKIVAHVRLSAAQEPWRIEHMRRRR